jgi:hypothetical protein
VLLHHKIAVAYDVGLQALVAASMDSGYDTHEEIDPNHWRGVVPLLAWYQLHGGSDEGDWAMSTFRPVCNPLRLHQYPKTEQ